MTRSYDKTHNAKYIHSYLIIVSSGLFMADIAEGALLLFPVLLRQISSQIYRLYS